MGARTCRILLEQFFSPFADDCLRRILATPITKTADEYRIVIVDRSQREKGIFRVELFDLLQGLRSRVSFRKLSQRLSQEILHRGFVPELVNVGVMPLIASSLEVRDMRKENRLAREKHTHGRRRSFFINAQAIPHRQGRERARDHQNENSSHECLN